MRTILLKDCYIIKGEHINGMTVAEAFDPIITLDEAKEMFKLWRGDRWKIKEVFQCEGFERLREFLKDIDVTDIHINVY